MNKSRNCSLRAEHKNRIILNALQRIHFNTSFWCYMNFKIIFLKSMNLYAFIYAIVSQIMKRYKLNCKVELVKKIRYLGKITKIWSWKNHCFFVWVLFMLAATKLFKCSSNFFKAPFSVQNYIIVLSHCLKCFWMYPNSPHIFSLNLWQIKLRQILRQIS